MKLFQLRRSWLLAVLVFLLLCGILLGSFGATNAWAEYQRSLIPVPTTPAPTPTPIIPVLVETSEPGSSGSGSAAAFTFWEGVNLPSLASGTLCNGPETMYVLFAGTDHPKGYYIGRSDAIRVARLDFVNGKVSVLAFPRDLWVTIPRLEKWGLYGGKINASYSWGNVFLKNSQGPWLLARTLKLNFGVPVDRYVAMNEGVLRLVVNSVGGIDINVTRAVGPFKEGVTHMDGPTAKHYAAIRKTDSDFRRIDRQSEIALAFRDKVMQPEVWRMAPSLVVKFYDQVLTDLSMADISKLLCLASKLEPEDITFNKIRGSMLESSTSEGGLYILKPKVATIRNYVQKFINGDL